MEAAQTREYVDRRYEDREVNELPDAPIEALRGLGKRGSEALQKALGVKTVRDLATNDFVLKAQEVLKLAEGPAASPAVAPTRADVTGQVPRVRPEQFRTEPVEVEQPDRRW